MRSLQAEERSRPCEARPPINAAKVTRTFLTSLDNAAAEALRDELFYQRAIHAYMLMQPALNTVGMRDGSEKASGAGHNVLPIER